MIDFYRMSDKDIILLSAAVALILADGLDSDELNILGNFIQCVGQDLVSAAAQKALCEVKDGDKNSGIERNKADENKS